MDKDTRIVVFSLLGALYLFLIGTLFIVADESNRKMKVQEQNQALKFYQFQEESRARNAHLLGH